MFEGRFTVLMAVYGGDDAVRFERALASVYRNTLAPDEVVLVVDGAVPEAIDRVIRCFEAEMGLRQVRLAENVGLAAALNRGLEFVETAWVVRADADDVNVSDRFERQARAIERSGGAVDLLGGTILEVDDAGAPHDVRAVPSTHGEIVRCLRVRNPFNHMTVAFRTACVREAGGYPNIQLKEDYALWATMIARGARCQNIDDILVLATTGRNMYRRRGGVQYAMSEIELQSHLIRLGVRRSVSALPVGLGRASVALIPTSVRAWVYHKFLRTRPSRSDVLRVLYDPDSEDFRTDHRQTDRRAG